MKHDYSGIADHDIDKIVDVMVEEGKPLLDWRMGWGMKNPTTVDDVRWLLLLMGDVFHAEWLAAMRKNEAPPEDVSPGEPFYNAARVMTRFSVKDANDKAEGK